MIKIGIVGIGFMGMIHYYGIQRGKGAEVVAICTRDPKKLAGDWTGIQGNFGPRGGMEDLSNIRKYNDIDELLADGEIDLVDICLPTHLHKSVSIASLQAGKHTLVEKPISIDIDDANEIVELAEQTDKEFMVAHVLPFFAEYAYAKQAVESGEYGELLGAHFKRIISKPSWSRDIADIEKSGGPGIDLHIHDTHFIQLLCGVPDAVFSQGKLAGGNFLDFLTTQYIYNDKELTVSCSSGAISQKGRAFSHGFEVFLEKATLLFDFSTLAGEPSTAMPLTLITEDGNVEQVDLGEVDPIDAFTAEIQYAVDAIDWEEEPTALSGVGARDALLLCYKEAESVKTGKVVAVR
ncbi:MAG: Gfo/Idh/MocA family oxidoreductase [Candidatus Poribacteria bacterium]|nr:Gfo/Idh/MocA family oxidoreductase [Candidatus Poribacteria bacterium]